MLEEIFGTGSELHWWQMSARAALVFTLCLLLLRISGRRSFSLRSSFDTCITILLGAILGRAVTGASPFFPTLSACLMLVLLHRGLAWLCVRSGTISRLANGRPMQLFRDGQIIEGNLGRGLVSEEDIREELRLKNRTTNFQDVEAMYLERNGEISVVEKR